MLSKSEEEVLSHLREQVEDSIKVKKHFFETAEKEILKASQAIGDCFRAKGKLLVCGNGGSASDAQHFSGELVGRFLKERKGLPAISLSTDTSVLTALANDYGYETVFARQVQALGKSEDILFAISTSGNSPNVLAAAETAKKKSMGVIALTGNDGGKLGKTADIHLNVSLGKTSPRTQETHITLIHILVDLLDEFYLT